MNLLDENFPADQAEILRAARVPHRQIGRDVLYFGVQDPNIIPLLHRFKRVTLFTQDKDFFRSTLCHSTYCLVWLDVKPAETAVYVRLFLKHPAFNTHAKRLGTVARVNAQGIQYWRRGELGKTLISWPD